MCTQPNLHGSIQILTNDCERPLKGPHTLNGFVIDNFKEIKEK